MTTPEPSAPATLTSSSGHARLAKQWAQLAHREGFGSDRTVIDMIIGHVDELDAQLRAALTPSPSPVVAPERETVLHLLNRWDTDCGYQIGALIGDLRSALYPKRPEEGKS